MGTAIATTLMCAWARHALRNAVRCFENEINFRTRVPASQHVRAASALLAHALKATDWAKSTLVDNLQRFFHTV